MFNKPDVFGRRDTTPPRRDTVPVLNSAAQSTSASAVAVRSAALNPPGDAAPVPTSAGSASGGKEAPSGEHETGARLIVGPDVKLKGAEILDCDTLVVEGRVEATMDSRLLRIATKGAFIGKVSIDIAEIHGTFEGELTARSQLVIHATGRVSGTIRFGKLVVEEGGELNGEISVISANPVPERKVVSEPYVARSAAAG